MAGFEEIDEIPENVKKVLSKTGNKPILKGFNGKSMQIELPGGQAASENLKNEIKNVLSKQERAEGLSNLLKMMVPSIQGLTQQPMGLPKGANRNMDIFTNLKGAVPDTVQGAGNYLFDAIGRNEPRDSYRQVYAEGYPKALQGATGAGSITRLVDSEKEAGGNTILGKTMPNESSKESEFRSWIDKVRQQIELADGKPHPELTYENLILKKMK